MIKLLVVKAIGQPFYYGEVSNNSLSLKKQSKTMNIQYRDFFPEFSFSSSRSSGPGGQNVNKVNSRIELRFNVEKSFQLSENEKEIILKKLKNRINSEGELLIAVQTDRSQLKNKELAIDLFYNLITKALTPRKPRKSTTPTRASVEKRLETKKQDGEKKMLRKKPDL